MVYLELLCATLAIRTASHVCSVVAGAQNSRSSHCIFRELVVTGHYPGELALKSYLSSSLLSLMNLRVRFTTNSCTKRHGWQATGYTTDSTQRPRLSVKDAALHARTNVSNLSRVFLRFTLSRITASPMAVPAFLLSLISSLSLLRQWSNIPRTNHKMRRRRGGGEEFKVKCDLDLMHDRISQKNTSLHIA